MPLYIDAENQHSIRLSSSHLPSICSKVIPDPLRPDPKESVPHSRLENIKRRLTESACEHETQRTLQQLFSACDHNIETWQRSSIGQLIERFETVDTSEDIAQAKRLPASESLNCPSNFAYDHKPRKYDWRPPTYSASSGCNKGQKSYIIQILPSDTTPILLSVRTTGFVQLTSSEPSIPMADERLQKQSIAGDVEHVPAESTQSPKRPIAMRRNIFGPSDPLIARPESSAINAEGKIQARTRQSTQDLSAQNTEHDSEGNPVKRPVETDTDSTAALVMDEVSDKEHAGLEQHKPTFPTVLVPDEPVTATRNSLEQDRVDDDAKASPVDILSHPGVSPPNVMVQSPSEPASKSQSPVLGTLPIASASSVNVPSPPYSSPVATGSASNVLPNKPIGPQDIMDVPSNIDSTIQSITQPQALGDTLAQVPKLLSPSALPVSLGGRVTKRRRLIRRVRKVVLRRRVLAVLLGRELGDVTHAQLQQVQSVTDVAPIPVSL